MKYSYTDHTGDGSTISFPFSFVGPAPAYLSPSHIKVYVNGVLRNHTLTNTNQVTITPAPSSGTQVRIRRIVPKTALFANFGRGNSFTGPLLNKNFLQQLYAYHEFLDGFITEEQSWLVHTDINMNGKSINNLGDAVNSKDAVNLSQVQALIASGGVVGGQGTIVSESAPTATSTQAGLKWYKPSTSTEYIWYCDADSCQWVQVL